MNHALLTPVTSWMMPPEDLHVLNPQNLWKRDVEKVFELRIWGWELYPGLSTWVWYNSRVLVKKERQENKSEKQEMELQKQEVGVMCRRGHELRIQVVSRNWTCQGNREIKLPNGTQPYWPLKTSGEGTIRGGMDGSVFLIMSLRPPRTSYLIIPVTFNCQLCCPILPRAFFACPPSTLTHLLALGKWWLPHLVRKTKYLNTKENLKL